MIGVILEGGRPTSCEPLTSTRALDSFPVANLPLREVLALRLRQAGFADQAEADPESRCLYLTGATWVSLKCLAQLLEADEEAVLVDGTGEGLAWIGKSAREPAAATRLKGDASSFRIRYPWDLLTVNQEAVGMTLESRPVEAPPPGVTVEGRLEVGTGTTFLPGVYIEGDVLIGNHCKIGPNCYLRGTTAVGDGCRIGQGVEIKNSIILSGTSIGHLSYCGDSIVCEDVNFGAGTIVANFRHDGKNHRSMIEGRLVDTGRRKFGAVIGAGVHTGIHTSIYPGRKLWPHTSTRPGETVAYDIRGEGEDSSPSGREG